MILALDDLRSHATDAASGLAADEDEEAALAELHLLIKLLKEAIRAGALAPEPLAPGAGASSAGTPMTWAEGSAVAGELLPSDLVTQIVEFLRSLIKTLTWPVPVVEAGREGAWKTDREFGRQILAGQNPVGIVAITSKDDISALEAKGSTLFKAVRDDYGGQLEGKSLEELAAAPGQPRLFYVDYAPDALLPYLARVRDAYQDRALHAGRVLLHLSDAGDLLPVVIELKSDPDELFIAYTPKSGEALWLLAKTVFSSLGACVDLTILNAGVPGQILDDGSARARRGVICLAKPKASLPR
ncbi:hypothetical protein MNEG_8538 [Monoraphidium neglectum]|uniref:Lipoxygenase domain-containing protein n=1 Tax=Monoraphidium neglectum TaxID=145388 RepID=A0A0D2MFB8_9CHLO|nr:hypothetical protein MNEG_8538 [Monoraphidium neglectum]KIY99421.1 hypothetical protein MNEG_8538 [Monoraphidium neglectum]|eukprot:XP_013898441.1 hypothetical protein MNEG_8538 [Monoraphidium neglectum]